MSEDKPKPKMNGRSYSNFPTKLAKSAEKVTRPIFRKHGIAESRILSEWPLIVGSVLAEKSLPARLSFPKGQKSGGTLHLNVASGWALEVQHLEPVILEKIATYFGYRAVGKLSLKQGPIPKRPKKVEKTTQRPLTEEEQQVLNSITSNVENAELREALASLGSAILTKEES